MVLPWEHTMVPRASPFPKSRDFSGHPHKGPAGRPGGSGSHPAGRPESNLLGCPEQATPMVIFPTGFWGVALGGFWVTLWAWRIRSTA